MTDGGGFDLDGGTTNSIAQYNYSHDNDGPGFSLVEFGGARPYYNNTLRYNISQNDGRKYASTGIVLWSGGSPVSNTEVYNNTVFMTPNPIRNTSAVALLSATTNTHIRNNIVLAYNNCWALWAEPGQSGLIMAGNDYWTGGGWLFLGVNDSYYYDLPSFRSGTGLEQVNGQPAGYNVDPGLYNPGSGGAINNSDYLYTLSAYQLRPGSPMIDAALNLNNYGIYPGPNDFYGTAIPQGSGYDIGAAEWH